MLDQDEYEIWTSLSKIGATTLNYWYKEIIFRSFGKVCPYGDYYDGYETMFNDGDVQVYETFTNPLILRDGSIRDVTNNNIEVVLDIEHNFDLDIEDINQLLVFRIAMVPKVWF